VQSITPAPRRRRALLRLLDETLLTRGRTGAANAVRCLITTSPPTPEPAVFHEASGTIRFWVMVDDRLVGASVSPLTLHYSYPPQTAGEDAMETFRNNLPRLEAVVRQRLVSGSREPIMLREHDLRAPSP
jgi:hypothetical protein